jgi:hypothetical protein
MPRHSGSRYADLTLAPSAAGYQQILVGAGGLGCAIEMDVQSTPLSAAWRHSVGVMPDQRRKAREKALASA